MLPAAAIVGRVVDWASGAAVPNMVVRVYSRPGMKVGADGAVVRLEIDDPQYLITAHSAATKTGADGRYRLGNLPAGVYDVWAAPSKDDPAQAGLFNRGASAVAVNAGAAPTTAPDLVVGPGGLVRAQLIDAATGKPPQLSAGAVVAPSCEFVGGPQMQDQVPVRAPLSADGKFEFRAAPGKFRIHAIVMMPGSENPNEPVYTTSFDVLSTGEVPEVAHGQAIDATLSVWNYRELRAKSERRSKAWALAETNKPDAIIGFSEFLADYPDDREALLGRARCHKSLGNFSEAIADLEHLLRVQSDDIQARVMLAELLATAADGALRNGARAIELAAGATQTLRSQDVDTEGLGAALSALAAAYAEEGKFDLAISTQREAIQLVAESRRGELQKRLQLYERVQPFHREK